MIKLFIVLMLISMYAYPQDSLPVTNNSISPAEYNIMLELKMDSLKQLLNKEKERVDSLYKYSYTIEKVGNMEYYIAGKINKANNLYYNSKRLYRKAIRKTNEKDKEILFDRSNEMKRQADTNIYILNEHFPLSSQFNSKININSEKLQRSKNIIKGAGVFQILTGIAGLVITIVDANMEERIATEVPDPRNSRLTTKETTHIKHEWGMSHTISTVLSGGFIVSGIITVNF